MLNVTIQNDGKIKIQSECSNTKEMRHNVNLLLAVVSSMEQEMLLNLSDVFVESLKIKYDDKSL